MLAEIGIIVGLYIITRLVPFLLRKDNRAENIIVKILSVITIIITIIVIGDLLLRGFNITSPKHISNIWGHEQSDKKPTGNVKKAGESTQPNKDVIFDQTRMSNEGYQDVKWGMNKEEVTRLTGATPSNGFLANEITIAGEKAGILYFFTKDKLYMVVIPIILDTMNNNKYLVKFNEMEKILITYAFSSEKVMVEVIKQA